MTAMIKLIEQLPVTAAGPSRDFGRGYSQAIKDVVMLLQVVPAYGAALAEVDRYLERRRQEDAAAEGELPCNECSQQMGMDGAWGLCSECVMKAKW